MNAAALRARFVLAGWLAAAVFGISALAPAAATDVAGWRGAHWGMTADDLRRVFGAELTELPARRIYKNAYAELALLRAAFLGATFDAYFQMNAETDRLQQVLLETGRRRAGPHDFDELLHRLRHHYGNETKLCLDRLSDGSPAGGEAVWRLSSTTVHAVFMEFYTRGMAFDDPNRDRDPLVPYYKTRRNNPRFLPRRIVLRYHPSTRTDLIGERCRPAD